MYNTCTLPFLLPTLEMVSSVPEAEATHCCAHHTGRPPCIVVQCETLWTYFPLSFLFSKVRPGFPKAF